MLEQSKTIYAIVEHPADGDITIVEAVSDYKEALKRVKAWNEHRGKNIVLDDDGEFYDFAETDDDYVYYEIEHVILDDKPHNFKD